MTSGPGPLQARLGLALIAGFALACVRASGVAAPAPTATTTATAGDFALYERVVERVRGGEGYYDAAGQELRSRGFPTRSAFNWRPPTYAWFLGRVTGSWWGSRILAAGTVLTAAVWARQLAADQGAVPATLGGLALAGSAAWTLNGRAYLMTEFWAAMLIGASVCAYRGGRVWLGVVAGLLAVFYRELSLPYAVVCLGISVRQGRRWESAAWVVGLTAFAVFLGHHAAEVRSRVTADDLGLANGWVRFGGLGFLVATARTNVLLQTLPDWCAGVYLALAVVGLAGGRGESGWRSGLSAGLFLAAFSVVGNPFNFYWGFLTAPLLAAGTAGAPSIVWTLLTSAFPGRSPVPAPSP